MFLSCFNYNIYFHGIIVVKDEGLYEKKFCSVTGDGNEFFNDDYSGVCGRQW